MDPNAVDRQSQAVYLLLVIVGLVLAAVGWIRAIF
jgi:hypothetical protein